MESATVACELKSAKHKQKARFPHEISPTFCLVCALHSHSALCLRAFALLHFGHFQMRHTVAEDAQCCILSTATLWATKGPNAALFSIEFFFALTGTSCNFPTPPKLLIHRQYLPINPAPENDKSILSTCSSALSCVYLLRGERNSPAIRHNIFSPLFLFDTLPTRFAGSSSGLLRRIFTSLRDGKGVPNFGRSSCQHLSGRK